MNEYSDPQEAVSALRDGLVIDWQPGDMTRYECQIVEGIGRYVSEHERYLLVLNLGGPHVIPLTGRLWNVHKWVQAHPLPAGSWAGVRPLLAVLAYAEGKMAYLPEDAHKEAAERRRQYGDGEAPDRDDAELGRAVRRIVEAQGEGTPAPREPVRRGVWRHPDGTSCTSYPDSFNWTYTEQRTVCSHGQMMVCHREPVST